MAAVGASINWSRSVSAEEARRPGGQEASRARMQIILSSLCHTKVLASCLWPQTSGWGWDGGGAELRMFLHDLVKRVFARKPLRAVFPETPPVDR